MNAPWTGLRMGLPEPNFWRTKKNVRCRTETHFLAQISFWCVKNWVRTGSFGAPSEANVPVEGGHSQFQLRRVMSRTAARTSRFRRRGLSKRRDGRRGQDQGPGTPVPRAHGNVAGTTNDHQEGCTRRNAKAYVAAKYNPSKVTSHKKDLPQPGTAWFK